VTVPRRRKGFRTITVGEDAYRWKLFLGADSSRVIIYGSPSDSARLEVVLPLRDPWLNIGSPGLPGTAVTMLPLTGKFVREAILAGQRNGFRPDERGAVLILNFRDGQFSAV
jgi:hypothetical protein